MKLAKFRTRVSRVFSKAPVAIAGIAAIILLSGCTPRGELSVYDLKCNNLHNPLGIDNTVPRLSWKITGSRNGTAQAACQVLVASSPELLGKDQSDLWDSGKSGFSNSILVPYGGNPLHPGMACYWKVRIWDEKGDVSPWSPVAEFSIGLLSPEDWQASYIGFPTEAGYRECPQLMKSFDLEETGRRMLLHVNSLGYHEAWLNGQKIGDGVLAPAVSQFTKRSRVITYDVTSLLKKGRNNLMLWLGSGWYTQGLPGVSNNGPLVKARLECPTGDGSNVILVTDDTWQGRKSAYTRHGDWRPHQFGGEIVDGSLAQDDLQTDSREGRDWAPVSVAAVPEAEASPQMVEQNRILETWKPAKIEKLAQDTFLVDMGRNLTGWFGIRFPELQKSQEVVMEYSDQLDKEGKFVDQRQADRYIASGQGREVFQNKFNYHGFRYVRISNLKVAPVNDSVTASLISTGYEAASAFSCSDPELNSIHNMISYTLRCLSLGGYLVDCPQIERLGYGGDGNASTETAQTMFGLNPLYANWLQAWADCIRDDGGMPHTAPNPYPAGGGPYWCGFIITASWKTYQHYGDVSVLEKYYPVMQKWLGFADLHTVDGMLKRWPDTDYRGWYLGDWASPEGVDQTAETSVDLVNNCFLAVCFDKMQKIADVLGKSGDAAGYGEKRAMLQKRIHERFFHPGLKSYGTGTQIDLAYPLLAGVVPEGLVEDVTRTLTSITENKHGGHLACGLVGIPVLTEWAVNSQATDLMYNMLKKKEYPGYLYMIENGATTTWEHWNGNRSQIHNCYNGIGQWFYQAVGGIMPAGNGVAWREFLVRPQIPEGVTWAKTKVESPFGTIGVDWEIRDGELLMEVRIPVGSEANLCLPEKARKVRIGNRSVSDPSGIIRLESGRHLIRTLM
ncbi:MAG: family 78 glycoside hydrolase catalytic domain [Bacteroidia bacterium]|nr:family 78 glycoside hydrolase catalytic domain [Bacteroidia bacterium]